jgi:hypothetical protein
MAFTFERDAKNYPKYGPVHQGKNSASPSQFSLSFDN